MQTKKISPRIAYGLYTLVGFLFGFCFLTGRDLAGQGNILWNGSYTVKTLLLSLLIGLAVAAVFCFGLYSVWWQEKTARWAQPLRTSYDKLETHPLVAKFKALPAGKVFLLSMVLIVLSWLPYYLAYYPGICSYDTTIQVGQIVDGAYNDHHPIAHTLLLQGAMELGSKLFGDVNTGIGILVLIQLMILAASMAFGIALLHRKGVKVIWQVVILLYCMFMRFHGYMSVTTIKDTLFSAFLLLMMCSFYGILQKEELEIRSPWKLHLLWCVSAVGVMLFRNNGKYAFLVLIGILVLMVLFGKKTRKQSLKLLTEAVALFLVGNILLSALFSATGAEQGDRREMLSMPIQQLARCMLYHGGVGALAEDDASMSEDEKGLVNDFILDEGYRNYRAEISDPVKSHTNTYVVRYRAKEFLTTYLQLLFRYPGEFINAALAVNAGFLYTEDVSHATINVNGVDEGLGYVQTRWVDEELNARGIYKDSKWEGMHEKLESWADENAYLDIPLLRYLYMPGIYIWAYLLLTVYLVVQRRWRECIPFSMILGYYITLLLGPTVQMRYIYPMMIVLPFALLMTGRVRGGKYDR